MDCQPDPFLQLGTLTPGEEAEESFRLGSAKMDSDGGTSTSRRSGGGRDGERSSSSTLGFFAVKAGDERDGAAPKCHCGVYAVLYLSKTSSNPNRLFFGYPFFKIRERHCKFFLWLDKHASKFDRVEELKACREKHDVDVDVEFVRLNIEARVSELEEKVASMEKNRSRKTFVMCVCCCCHVVFACS